ncbi:zf-HC2 domain-containing protein [Clostridium sp. Marseille-P299]|uniref:zf-HC2 domain-containing protein n=1 Tax=Clostridium sp. Marseille-P299 TaxID=1805477 RepID=UPI0008315671|nr:zf-HC2 domain-containing protein [Clostridium sp. Marseille-P299]
MGKLSCEIIKDLIPSYVNNNCSKESEKLIKEHIIECGACTMRIYRMEAEKMVSVEEKKENHFLINVKNLVIDKNLLILGLMIAFIAIGMVFSISNNKGVSLSTYYVVSPFLTLGTYFILSKFTLKRVKTRWDFAMTGLGMFLTFYIIIIEYLIVQWLENATIPFGMLAARLGAFYPRQLLIVAFIHMIIFVVTILLSVKHRNSHSTLLTINVTGGCLAFAYLSMARKLYTIEVYATARNNIILILVIEGVLMALIACFLDRRKIQRNNAIILKP